VAEPPTVQPCEIIISSQQNSSLSYVQKVYSNVMSVSVPADFHELMDGDHVSGNHSTFVLFKQFSIFNIT
jgi:hypothetical protein